MSLVFLKFSSDSATILCVNENRLIYIITIIMIILMIIQLGLSGDGCVRDCVLFLSCGHVVFIFNRVGCDVPLQGFGDAVGFRDF